jgi:hypothetical protein
MRIIDQAESAKETPSKNAIEQTRKLNWPDLMFGPVNLWCLPSAAFFYGARKKAKTCVNVRSATL